MADDPVVAEVDVYHSSSLAEHLAILQYPLRPAHLPYQTVMAARTSSCGSLALDLSIRSRGENYSTSRGEGYARMSQLGSKVEERPYKSGLWDQLSLESQRCRDDPGRYVAGVLKDGELHLSPVSRVLQLRPSLEYLDSVAAGARASAAAVASDGETTGSEADEPVPVTVKFARRLSKPVTASFSNTLERDWSPLAYHDRASQEATEERGLLFCSEESNVVFDMSRSRYLDNVCPAEMPSSSGEPLTLPTGVISLASLKQLPLDQQIERVLGNAVVLQYGQLCSLLGGHSAALLRGVAQCAVLVQGCWVIKSSLLTPDNKSRIDNRDFILWSFTQKCLVPRKEIVGVVKLSHDELREVMGPLASQRGGGWEFRLATDHEFLSRHGSVVQSQEKAWASRHRQLTSDLDLKTKPRAATQEITDALQVFVAETIGRRVISLSELNDKLLLRQSVLGEEHPLREGVAQSALREALQVAGAVEIATGQTTVYALTHGDKVREIILELFKTNKSIRKKQVLDAVRDEGLDIADKAVSLSLKELCYTRGNQWRLLGTN